MEDCLPDWFEHFLEYCPFSIVVNYLYTIGLSDLLGFKFELKTVKGTWWRISSWALALGFPLAAVFLPRSIRADLMIMANSRRNLSLYFTSLHLFRLKIE